MRMLHALPHPGTPPLRDTPVGQPRGNDATVAKPPSPGTGSAFGDDGLTFGDVLDVINPLHHIPLLGNIYRKVSGDSIAPAARIGGGALFGGPLGAAVAAATVVVASLARGDGSGDDDPGNAAPRAGGPGGWMVAAARPAHAPATADDAVPAGDTREAVATSPPPARGGWMVAAARAAPPAAGRTAGEPPADVIASAPHAAQPEPATASTAPAAVRRGGWMVAAAYAVTDSMQREDKDAHRERLETVA